MDETKFSISYINKNEAMFILGLLYSLPCSHCPDFYKGCVTNFSLHENPCSEKDFVTTHVEGTEQFLCGKLRNIVTLSEAEEREVQQQFELNFSQRISLLSKKQDDENVKFVLVTDKEELKQTSKIVEDELVEKITNELEEANRQNSELVEEMEQQLIFQENKIKRLVSTIRKLKKKNLNKHVS